jgi:hypothetical protein
MIPGLMPFISQWELVLYLFNGWAATHYTWHSHGEMFRYADIPNIVTEALRA